MKAIVCAAALLLAGCQNPLDKHFEEMNDHFNELNSRIDYMEDSLKAIAEENEELKIEVQNNCGQ